MKKTSYYIVPLVISVLILTGFLGYYIRFVFQNEKVRLTQQMQLLFENAYESEKNIRWEILIKEIKDDVILVKQASEKKGINNDNIPTKLHRTLALDTLAGKRIIHSKLNSVQYQTENLLIFKNQDTIPENALSAATKESFKISNIDSLIESGQKFNNLDTNVKINIRVADLSQTVKMENLRKVETKQNAKKQEKEVSIKFTTSFSKDTIVLDLMPVNMKNVRLAFDTLLKENNLPNEYEIDTLNNKDGVLDKEFKYVVSPKNQNSFIYLSIFPQIGLSFIVLMAVVFGFLSMLYSLRKLDKLSREKQQFLSNMTHELKTPLSVVGVALEAIQNFDANNDRVRRNDYINIAQNENTKLVSLIDKILNFSKTSDSKVKLEKTNINEIIEHILVSFSPRFDQSKFVVSKFIDSLNQEIFTNEESLTFILQNLIDNALRYNDHTSPEIIIQKITDTNFVKISVIDNGKTIPDEYREKIFDKFYRIKNDLTHDQKGYGLGLYIARESAQAIGGKLEYTSSNERNTFTLTLPK
jgi:signal transduction histidine kinase